MVKGMGRLISGLPEADKEALQKKIDMRQDAGGRWWHLGCNWHHRLRCSSRGMVGSLAYILGGAAGKPFTALNALAPAPERIVRNKLAYLPCQGRLCGLCHGASGRVCGIPERCV